MLDIVNIYCCHSPCRIRAIFAFGIPHDVEGTPEKKWSPCRRIFEEPDVVSEILTEQFTTVRIVAFKDDRGKPARIDGIPQWATDNSDLLTLEVAPDGMSCKITTNTMPGSANVQMTADADLGPGVSPITGSILFNVTAPQATQVELSVDPTQDLP